MTAMDEKDDIDFELLKMRLNLLTSRAPGKIGLNDLLVNLGKMDDFCSLREELTSFFALVVKSRNHSTRMSVRQFEKSRKLNALEELGLIYVSYKHKPDARPQQSTIVKLTIRGLIAYRLFDLDSILLREVYSGKQSQLLYQETKKLLYQLYQFGILRFEIHKIDGLRFIFDGRAYTLPSLKSEDHRVSWQTLVNTKSHEFAFA